MHGTRREGLRSVPANGLPLMQLISSGSRWGTRTDRQIAAFNRREAVLD